MDNNYHKGDKAVLYCEFKYNNIIIIPSEPKVRVLHEYGDNIYEDLKWTDMKKFNNGYIYNYDTSNCDNYGKYTIIYECEYNNSKINILDSFNMIVKNIEDINTVTLYGYVNDLNTKNHIEYVTIKIKNSEDDEITYQTSTDCDGKWYAYLYPGDYEFIFENEEYLERSVKVQIGDEHNEIQFNSISLEKITDKVLGNGMFKIQDTFTNKSNFGIENISIKIFNISDLENIIVETITDNKGNWKVFLNSGEYMLQADTPSGDPRLFRMNVFNNGDKTIGEVKTNDSAMILEKKNNGNGPKLINDYVLNAHGEGIKNITVSAYKYNVNDDNYEYVAEDITNETGNFELNLNIGKYKLICSGDNYISKQQILTIEQ